jgi:hypothetical protein
MGGRRVGRKLARIAAGTCATMDRRQRAHTRTTTLLLIRRTVTTGPVVHHEGRANTSRSRRILDVTGRRVAREVTTPRGVARRGDRVNGRWARRAERVRTAVVGIREARTECPAALHAALAHADVERRMLHEAVGCITETLGARLLKPTRRVAREVTSAIRARGLAVRRNRTRLIVACVHATKGRYVGYVDATPAGARVGSRGALHTGARTGRTSREAFAGRFAGGLLSNTRHARCDALIVTGELRVEAVSAGRDAGTVAVELAAIARGAVCHTGSVTRDGRSVAALAVRRAGAVAREGLAVTALAIVDARAFTCHVAVSALVAGGAGVSRGATDIRIATVACIVARLLACLLARLLARVQWVRSVG